MSSSRSSSPRVHTPSGSGRGPAMTSSSVGKGPPYLSPSPMKSTSSNVSAIPSFRFSSRTQRINWLHVTSLPIDEIERQNDVKSVLALLHNLTYSDMVLEDFEQHSNAEFVGLFRIFQMIVEYLVYGQNVLVQKRSDADTALRNSHEELQELRDRLEKMRLENESLQRDVKRYKKTVRMFEYVLDQQPFVGHKCKYCDKVFANETYLGTHLEKRHVAELLQDGFHDADGYFSKHSRRKDHPSSPQKVLTEDIVHMVEPLISKMMNDSESRFEELRKGFQSIAEERKHQETVLATIEETSKTREAEFSKLHEAEMQMLQSRLNEMREQILTTFYQQLSEMSRFQAMAASSTPRRERQVEVPVVRDVDEFQKDHFEKLVTEKVEESVKASQAAIEQARLHSSKLEAELTRTREVLEEERKNQQVRDQQFNSVIEELRRELISSRELASVALATSTAQTNASSSHTSEDLLRERMERDEVHIAELLKKQRDELQRDFSDLARNLSERHQSMIADFQREKEDYEIKISRLQNEIQSVAARPPYVQPTIVEPVIIPSSIDVPIPQEEEPSEQPLPPPSPASESHVDSPSSLPPSPPKEERDILSKNQIVIPKYRTQIKGAPESISSLFPLRKDEWGSTRDQVMRLLHSNMEREGYTQRASRSSIEMKEMFESYLTSSNRSIPDAVQPHRDEVRQWLSHVCPAEDLDANVSSHPILFPRRAPELVATPSSEAFSQSIASVTSSRPSNESNLSNRVSHSIPGSDSSPRRSPLGLPPRSPEATQVNHGSLAEALSSASTTGSPPRDENLKPIDASTLRESLETVSKVVGGYGGTQPSIRSYEVQPRIPSVSGSRTPSPLPSPRASPRPPAPLPPVSQSTHSSAISSVVQPSTPLTPSTPSSLDARLSVEPSSSSSRRPRPPPPPPPPPPSVSSSAPVHSTSVVEPMIAPLSSLSSLSSSTPTGPSVHTIRVPRLDPVPRLSATTSSSVAPPTTESENTLSLYDTSTMDRGRGGNGVVSSFSPVEDFVDDDDDIEEILA